MCLGFECENGVDTLKADGITIKKFISKKAWNFLNIGIVIQVIRSL